MFKRNHKPPPRETPAPAPRPGKQPEPTRQERPIRPEEYKIVAELFSVQNRLAELQAALTAARAEHQQIVKALELPPCRPFLIDFAKDTISWEEEAPR